MVCRVRDGRGGQREPGAEVGEQTVSLVAWPYLQGGISISTYKDSSRGIFFGKIINSSFKQRNFMNKFILKATCGEVNGDVDSCLVIRMVEDYREEPA